MIDFRPSDLLYSAAWPEHRHEVREFVKSFRPMQRMGTVEDVADTAEYLAGDLAGFVSGQNLMVSGGGPA
ncbi:SDR family oxidoreductase [Rhizobium tibeticum]|uniref:SDR family oxidoreductase n=1 Tax=Rhizobium tibeticum TaxID=501024 RepID=UPI003522537F